MRVPSLSCEEHLEEGMAIHFHILAWRISWTEEPGGLQSIGSQAVGYDMGLINASYYRCYEYLPFTHSSHIVLCVCPSLFTD